MDSRNQRKISVREADGSIRPFSASALRTRLLDGFLEAGLRDSVDIAEDIALAVEYTLCNTPRPEAVFGRGELDGAVLRLLEEAGFPEVAGVFGRVNPVRSGWIVPEREALLALLRSHLAASPERLDRIADAVLDSVKKLGFEMLSPHLLLELARHNEAAFALEASCRSTVPASGRGNLSFSRRDIDALLSSEEKRWFSDGVCRLNGVTALFPCVHFYFLMIPFARRENLGSSVTELELEPALDRAGAVLGGIKRKIDEALKTEKPLPCILSIPDMEAFFQRHIGSGSGFRELGAEFASVLSSSIAGGVYKCSLS